MLIRSLVLMLALLSAVVAVSAEDRAALAEQALTEILWDYEDSFQYVHYVMRGSGFVDVTFARDTPEDIYREIITRLRADARIDGILAGKTGPACGLWLGR